MSDKLYLVEMNIFIDNNLKMSYIHWQKSIFIGSIWINPFMEFIFK